MSETKTIPAPKRWIDLPESERPQLLEPRNEIYEYIKWRFPVPEKVSKPKFLPMWMACMMQFKTSWIA